MKMGLSYEQHSRNYINCTGNSTYKVVNNCTIDSIILKHKFFCLKNDLKIIDESKLPLIYMIPKLHKNLIEFRLSQVHIIVVLNL